MAHGHPITSKNIAQAQASYEALGLCYTCGIKKEKCLHVTIRHMMSESEYKSRNVDKMTYSQLRDLLAELKEPAAMRDQHGKGEAIRIDTARFDYRRAAQRALETNPLKAG
jgi:hypothetical protein